MTIPKRKCQRNILKQVMHVLWLSHDLIVLIAPETERSHLPGNSNGGAVEKENIEKCKGDASSRTIRADERPCMGRLGC
jgi:hypothetical protein